MSLKKVEAYEAWAVFASYDGNAPDTSDLVLFATEELADEFIKWLATSEGEEEMGGLCYNGGHEWCKEFLVRRVAVLDPDQVYETIAKFREDQAY